MKNSSSRLNRRQTGGCVVVTQQAMGKMANFVGLHHRGTPTFYRLKPMKDRMRRFASNLTYAMH